jgi:hypothetical protein
MKGMRLPDERRRDQIEAVAAALWAEREAIQAEATRLQRRKPLVTPWAAASAVSQATFRRFAAAAYRALIEDS